MVGENELKKYIPKLLKHVERGENMIDIKFYLLDKEKLPIEDVEKIVDVFKGYLKVYKQVLAEYDGGLQIYRLEHLYKKAVEKDNEQTALKVLSELNKVLGLGEQKIKIENTEYKLEI